MSYKYVLRFGVAALVAVALMAGAASSALAQLTTGTIRGRVADTDGRSVEAAQVTATNQETGVTIANVTTGDGRYVLGGVPVGPYTVRVRRIGFGPVEQRDIRVRLGETVSLDFQLQAAATQLEEVRVLAEQQPLIDRSQAGRVDQITEEQVEAIPTNGRNFADLVALSPSVGLNIGDGSGGNLSIGGGRRGANLIQIDGAGSTGTFFGGEARGSDRIPFAYSIETVREFQVVTNAYDVEYGFFAGGLINAVTKSGTNDFRGSVFGFFRNDALTGDDFFAREPTEFDARQFGGTLSGPIVRDRMHFYLSVERQDRDEPVFGLPAPGSVPDPSTGIHPDSMARFLDILSRVYGVEDEAGRFTQTQDEWAIFGRIDWQLNNQHRLTLRHNYTDLFQANDRISANELRGNGGIFENTGNSTVLQVNSLLTPSLTNEFRAQYATEPRPRQAYSLLPQARIDVRSDFGGGVQTFTVAECCNDPVLPNNLEETTLELANNLHLRTGGHTFKLGAHFNNFSYVNFFFFNQQGTYRFRSLADFEAGRVRDFARALPNPGPDGVFFTGDDVFPLAEYDVRELALYAQDTWEPIDRLSLILGVRVDNTSFPDKAPANAAAEAALGVRTDVAPGKTNLSPRLGFTYDLDGEGGRLLRGGIGLFYGRFPAVLYSNSLLNTGQNQLSLFCLGANAPAPDYQNFDPSDPASIPTACRTGAAQPPVATINSFAEDFDYPQSLKTNLGFEQALGERLKGGIDLVYSRTTDNFYVMDRNLRPEQFRSAIENRPVHAPAASVGGGGTVATGSNRVSTSFAEALEHVSPAEGRQYQATLRIEQRPTELFSWQAAYTYSNSKDNSSYSCCISSTAIFETPTAGDHRFLGEPGDEVNGTWGPSDFDRTHTIVLSGAARVPLGIEVSGILRMVSGSPWTPVVDGDPNGDSRFGNDRAFIGTNLEFDDPATDVATLQQHLEKWECLREQVGRIATRNSCRNPWVRMLDLRLRRAFPTLRGQEVEIVADLFNVLNLVNSDWGRVVGVSQFGGDRELLIVEGFDQTTQTYIYSVNPSFGDLSDLTPFRTDQFQMQLGVRYRF